MDFTKRVCGGDRVLVCYGEDFMLDALSLSSWTIFPKNRVDAVEGGDIAVMGRSLRQKVLSGKYHTVLLNDYFFEDDCWSLFCEDLVHFYEQGGTVIVHASNTSVHEKTNQHFGTQWNGFAYFRAVHSQTDAGKRVFPEAEGKLKQFSVKSNMMDNVPEHERLWCTTAESRTQSLVPTMAGRDSHPGSTSVALHEGDGGGRIFFFGDVNWEIETLHLMQMACKQAAARPACAMSPVSPANFENAVMLKTQGNGHFAAGQYPEACEKYVEALHLLGNPSDLVHREEASKIASNLAEAHLRQKDYSMACDAATGAVRLFASNYKALFRRAKAHESLGKLEDAIADLEECEKLQQEDGVSTSATAASLQAPK